MAHEHSHDYVKANKEHHNSQQHLEQHLAPVNRHMSGLAAEMLLHHFNFGPDTTVLDFACGAGMVSEKIRPHVKSIIGVDIAQQMVDTWNSRAKEAGFDADNFYAVQTDGLRDDDEELDGKKFDVVICTQSYHHFPDLDAITKALSRRLNPGGTLLVLDFDATLDDLLNGAEQAIKNNVAHKHGFARDEFKAIFEKTGRFESVTIEPTHQITFGELRAFGGPHNPAMRNSAPDETVLKYHLAKAVRSSS
ncbi:hypothetical protein OIO90_000333 [Microbotryomycetes sp. JL221]|nr:hypothetical protein OIO90_000333 [Microbotryomycetes sp. JL221]